MNSFSSDDFIVFTVSSDQKEYKKYLKESVTKIKGLQYRVIEGRRDSNIAKLYNNFIRSTTQRFIIFAHQDVEFSNDLINAVNRVYDERKVGAMGIIGKGFDNVSYYFGGARTGSKKNVENFQEVNCLDSCMCIIDRRHNSFFDELIFDGLHCFVEDYCCNQLFLGKKVLIIELDKIEHWGTTTKKEGSWWGNYRAYKEKLDNKWEGKVTSFST